MDEFRHNDDILATLRSLRMIPLTDGRIVSVESQTIFFPLSTSESNSSRRGETYELYFIIQVGILILVNLNIPKSSDIVLRLTFLAVNPDVDERYFKA